MDRRTGGGLCCYPIRVFWCHSRWILAASLESGVSWNLKSKVEPGHEAKLKLDFSTPLILKTYKGLSQFSKPLYPSIGIKYKYQETSTSFTLSSKTKVRKMGRGMEDAYPAFPSV